MSSKRIPGCYFVTRREPDVDSRMQTKCSSRDAREVKSTVTTHRTERRGPVPEASCQVMRLKEATVSEFWKRIKKSKVPLRLFLSPDASSFAFPTVNFSSASVVMRPNNRFSRATAAPSPRAHAHAHTHASFSNRQCKKQEHPDGKVLCFPRCSRLLSKGPTFRRGRILPRPGTSSLSLFSATFSYVKSEETNNSVVCLRRWCSL